MSDNIKMLTPSALGACLFALFIAMVLVRTAMLRKRGVRAIVFGRTDRSDFWLVPVVLAVVYALSAKTFGLPVWDVLVRPFWRGAAAGWVGLLLCAASVVGFGLTLVGFGTSFRVGIDEDKPDALVTRGMFAVSRNPLYLCFLVFFAGTFLIHRNITVSAAAVLFAAAVHRQILREEKFLASRYGAEYEEYCRKVRRYL